MACPNTRYLDLDGDLDLVRDPAQGGYTIEKGAMIPLISQDLALRCPEASLPNGNVLLNKRTFLAQMIVPSESTENITPSDEDWAAGEMIPILRQSDPGVLPCLAVLELTLP